MAAIPQPETFSPDVRQQLDRAAATCVRRGAKLTDLRRQVLGLILDAGAAVGAYDLLDRLRALRKGAAPPTVYRALEFLLEQGFIHRIERLSAFVSCLGDDEHQHAAQFLICRVCGKVAEIDDHDVSHALQDAARRRGFVIGGATIEAEGRCADCAAV